MYQDEMEMDEDMLMYPDEWDMNEQELFERSMLTAGLLLEREDDSLDVCRRCRWGCSDCREYDRDGDDNLIACPITYDRFRAFNARMAEVFGYPSCTCGWHLVHNRMANGLLRHTRSDFHEDISHDHWRQKVDRENGNIYPRKGR